MTTTNFLDATLAYTPDGFELVLPSGAVLRGTRTSDLPPPGPVTAGLEPGHLRLANPWERNTFLARVVRIEAGDEGNLVELDVVGYRLTAVDPGRERLEPGVTVAIAVDPAHLRAFAREPDG